MPFNPRIVGGNEAKENSVPWQVTTFSILCARIERGYFYRVVETFISFLVINIQKGCVVVQKSTSVWWNVDIFVIRIDGRSLCFGWSR